MSLTVKGLRDSIGRADLENSYSTSRTDPAERNMVARKNAFHALLETANAIPGISTVSGIVSITVGARDLVCSLTETGKASVCALKMMALGALAAIPGVGLVGNILNAVCAAGDVVDTVNAGGGFAPTNQVR